MKRRIFSIVLTLSLCLGMLPGAALAAANDVIVGGVRMAPSGTPIYAKTGENGVDVLSVDAGEPTDWNIMLTSDSGTPCLTLKNATIPGATYVKGEEALSSGQIHGGSGIYSDGPLKIELIGNNVVKATDSIPNEIIAVHVVGDLTITSNCGGTLEASSAGFTTIKNSTMRGIYAHGSLTISGSAEVTAVAGKKTSTTGQTIGVGTQTSITVLDNAKLTGIGGTGGESCIGISCHALSASNSAEVTAVADSDSMINEGIIFNIDSTSRLAVSDNAKVTAMAGENATLWSIGIDAEYISSPNTPFPITVSGEGELNIQGASSIDKGYAFYRDVKLTYSGGSITMACAAKLCKSTIGYSQKVNGSYIWRTSVDGAFSDSSESHDFKNDTYVEIGQGYTVTVTSADGEMGTVTGGGLCKKGSDVTVEATANSGYRLAKWTKDGSDVSTDNPYTFTVTEDTALIAVFEVQPAEAISISPATLVWAQGKTDTAPLTLAPQPVGGVYGTVTWTSSDEAVAAVDENGVVTPGVKAGTATITATTVADGNTLTATCAVTVNNVEDVEVIPPELDNANQFKVTMEAGLSEVPAAFTSNEELNSTAKIEAKIKAELTDVPAENAAVYDVKLMVKHGENGSWEEATADNFPGGGKLTVTLPYPEGTTDQYTFTVVHMFTTGNFGQTPGSVEKPPVTNTDKGIQFTVTGLSPISVGWTEPAAPPAPPAPPAPGGGSGDYDVITYSVSVEKVDHGTVTVNRKYAEKGDSVTVTATPDEGYALDTLTVTDAKGNKLELTGKDDGKYTFKMPGGKVSVAAVFIPVEEPPALVEEPPASCGGGADCPAHPFTDLDLSSWYHDGVHFCVEKGLMDGTSETTFAPEMETSRAMIVTILWRLQGSPVVNYAMRYNDVVEGTWYAEAVRWASSEGIVDGYDNGSFGPEDPITREQLALMLYRYEQKYGGGGFTGNWMFLLDFTDRAEVSEWAYEAVCWMTMNKVMDGRGEKVLDPQGKATRAEAAAMLERYIQTVGQ